MDALSFLEGKKTAVDFLDEADTGLQRKKPLGIVDFYDDPTMYDSGAEKFKEVRSRIGSAWDRGKAQTQLGLLRAEQLFGNESPEISASIATVKSTMPQEYKGKRDLFEKGASATAEMLPTMLKGLKAGQTRGTLMGLGMAGIAAAAGQAGPQVLTPEEIITVPGAFGAGYTVGQVSGSIENIGKIEAGLAYDELLDLKDKQGRPLSPTVAKSAAMSVGAVNAAIEMSQIGMLLKTIPGADKIIQKAANRAILNTIKKKTLHGIALKAAGRYGGTIAAETGQEVLQESTNILASEVAKEIDRELGKSNIPAATRNEIANRLIETAQQSALAFAGMVIPGAMVSTANRVSGLKPAEITTAEPEEEAPRAPTLDESIARFQEGLASGEIPMEQAIQLRDRQQGPVRDALDKIITDYTQSQAQQPTQGMPPAEILTEPEQAPPTAQESAQVFEQAPSTAAEAFLEFEQAGLTDTPVEARRKANQAIIDRTNLEAEAELERNRLAREKMALEAEQRRAEAQAGEKEGQIERRQLVSGPGGAIGFAERRRQGMREAEDRRVSTEGPVEAKEPTPAVSEQGVKPVRPSTAILNEGIGGKKVGAIESVDNTTPQAVDWLIGQDVQQITVRNTLSRHKTKYAQLAQDRLRKLGWQQWDKNKSVWTRPAESGKKEVKASPKAKGLLSGEYLFSGVVHPSLKSSYASDMPKMAANFAEQLQALPLKNAGKTGEGVVRVYKKTDARYQSQNEYILSDDATPIMELTPEEARRLMGLKEEVKPAPGKGEIPTAETPAPDGGKSVVKTEKFKASHLTSKEAAKNIRKNGFSLETFGRGAGAGSGEPAGVFLSRYGGEDFAKEVSDRELPYNEKVDVEVSGKVLYWDKDDRYKFNTETQLNFIKQKYGLNDQDAEAVYKFKAGYLKKNLELSRIAKDFATNPETDAEVSRFQAEQLKKQGYDIVEYKEGFRGVIQTIVLDPKAIKIISPSQSSPPKQVGKPSPQAEKIQSAEDALGWIYSSSRSVYDQINKSWIDSSREQILKAIEDGKKAGLIIEYIPAKNSRQAEIWKIKAPEGATFQLGRELSGRTTWLQTGLPKKGRAKQASEPRKKTEPSPQAEQAPESKPEQPGSAWVAGQRKPFINPRKITRGKRKGKYEIYLTRGREADGTIKQGARKIVDEKDIVSWPEKVKTEVPGLNVKESQKEIIATDEMNGVKYEFRIGRVNDPSMPQMTHQAQMRRVGSNVEWESAMTGMATSHKNAIRHFAERYDRVGDIRKLNVIDNSLQEFVDDEIRLQDEKEFERERQDEKRELERIKTQEDLARRHANEEIIIEQVKKARAKKRTIKLKVQEGAETINALSIGSYAYAKSYDKGYSVTHIPSGMAVQKGLSASEARELTYRLSLIRESWDGKGRNPPKGFKDSLQKVMDDFRTRRVIKPLDTETEYNAKLAEYTEARQKAKDADRIAETDIRKAEEAVRRTVEAEKETPAELPAAAEGGQERTARDYQKTWDTQSKLGRRVELVKSGGWVTKSGKLTKLGEKIAESKWNDISPAAQKVLKDRIDSYYSDVSQEPINKVRKKLTDQTGSSQLATDIYNTAFDLAQRGVKSFNEFRVRMARQFKDVWSKIRGLMRELYDSVKRVLVNERGEVGTKGDEIDQLFNKYFGAIEQKPTQKAKKEIIKQPQSSFNVVNKQIRETDKTLWNRAGKMLKRQLAPGGLLPRSVFSEKIIRDSQFEAIEFDVQHLNGVLGKAVKRDFHKSFEKLPDDIKQKLSESLSGNLDESLPRKTREAVIMMRQYIDSLSSEYSQILADQAQQILAEGKTESAIAKVDLLNTIIGNMGQYVHRSYRAFDDPKWYKKVPEDILNNAIEYLKNRYEEIGISDAANRAAVKANEILKTGTAYDSLEGFIKESKLGAKDLSVLKRRKQIAPEIRKLLGEYEDPRINFTKTATKMGRLVWNQKFLDKVREHGMGVFLFEDVDKPLGAIKQIAAEGSEVYSPLNGLWTFPEIEQAFKDALGRENMDQWYRSIIQLNGLVKFGKTVASPTTVARNWQSAMFFSIANGHFNLAKMRNSLSGLREYFTQQGSGAKLKYLRHLKELGVVYDTPYAGEMMRLLEDAANKDVLFSPSKLKFKRGLKYIQKFYQYGDDFWKIIGFENEKNSLIKAGMNETEAEKEAAERIRNTYPTYSMVGRFVQKLRRFPLAGTFVSFPAEIIRTSANILRYAAKDLKAGRKALALKRMSGIAIASGLAYGLQELSKTWLGVDDDEDEAVRRLAAPWNRNSNLLYIGRDEKGRLRYIDLSYLDPYNYFKRPVTAILRDQPWEKKLSDSIVESFEPFFGVDITAETILEIVSNKRRGSGSKIWSENDSPIEILGDMTDHLRKTLQPGIVSNIERTLKAIKGEYSPSGKQYNLSDEALAWVGYRLTTLDPKVSVYYRSFEFKDDKIDALSTIRKALRNPNRVSGNELQDSYQSSMRSLQKVYRDMALIVQAAMKNGLPEAETRKILRTSGISMRDTVILLDNKEPNWMPSKQQRLNDIRKASALRGRNNEVRERYQKLRKIINKERE